MKELDKQFLVDPKNSIANPKNVIKGQKYRFTVLSDRLIRMEYSKDGVFEDKPTSLVWYRNQDAVKFNVKEDTRYLEITTSYFRVTYLKEKPFYSGKFNTMKYLKVELLNTDRIWYFGHPEVRNYGSPSVSLDVIKGKATRKKGLYSVDGFVTIDDSKNDIIENGEFIPREKTTIDTYLFMYLRDYALCLKDYYSLTGYPSLIPRYALGNWWSKNTTYDDSKLKDLIDEFEQKEIPLSILLLDRAWHIKQYKEKQLDSGFTWNENEFKNPKSMINYLHKKGIRIGLNIDPMGGIYPFENNYEKAREQLNITSEVIPFNVYDTATVEAYFELFIHPLDQDQVDFFWLDDDELTDLKASWSLNHFHFLDMQRDYKRRPMVMSRNTGVAEHRYPVLYSGKTKVNWETLKTIPLHNASSANIGVSFWAHDIGGYYQGIEDNELYTRFVQLGVFSPILKLGSDEGKYYKREPWRWNVKTYEITKQYLQLRHRLIPYLYAEAYKYHKYGMPLIMPVYYKYPELYDDVNYRNAYYFGTEFFIAPIINKKDYIMNRVIHKFFLPDGVWYDFVTGKKFIGGKSYISFFKDEDYPVFAKAGSIITLGDNKLLNDTTPPDELEIQVFPGKSNTYNLYEDDGVSNIFLKGFYLNTQIDYNYMPNNYTVIIRPTEGKKGIIPDTRNYKIVFRNTKKANDVIVYYQDQTLKSKNYTKDNDFIVEINNVGTTGQLTINCKGNDIEIDAVRIINDDVEGIISDLQIETKMKEKIDKVLFSDLTIKKKRIAIRRLGFKGLEKKFVRLFLKILEYIKEV